MAMIKREIINKERLLVGTKNDINFYFFLQVVFRSFLTFRCYSEFQKFKNERFIISF